MRVIGTIIVCLLFNSTYQLRAQETPETETKESMLTVEEYRPSGKWRLAVGGGYAYRLGEREKESDPVVDKASKKLMHGGHLDVECQYFFNPVWGIGVTSNFVSAGSRMNDIYLIADGDTYFFNTFDVRNNFTFIGPSGIVKGDFTKWSLIGSMAMGPLFFKETTKMDQNGWKYTSTATKATFGVNVGIGTEYRFSSQMGAGLKLSYTAGTINSIRIDGENYDLTDHFSVSNFMVTAFLSFRSR